MTMQLGVIMDPIQSIRIDHDSTFAMLLEAQQRHWQIFYMEAKDLFVRGDEVCARTRTLHVTEDAKHWFEFGTEQNLPLQQLDVILMRKDPPVDMEYIYTTQLLELAEQRGTLIVNKPQSLRDFNEKLFINHFPQCLAPTLITCQTKQVRDFLQEHTDIICKPLHGMGGEKVFRLRQQDPNLNVVLEVLTQRDTCYMMAQRYIPEISAGDKRILLIDGKPVPHALARIAVQGETRANMAVGGRGHAVALTERDRWICAQIAPTLRAKGLLFVGIDVIGDYLTEINITSPTCIRELDTSCNLNISAQLLDCIIKYRTA